MQLKVLSEFCNSFKDLQPFDEMHVMFHVNWNVGEYLLPIPLCFVILLKMSITFLFVHKEDFWVGCFVCLPACFTDEKNPDFVYSERLLGWVRTQ